MYDEIYDDDDVFEPLDIGVSLEHRATLVTARGGGPLRTIITGSKRYATGRYISAKTGRAHPWKFEGEPSRLMICEADANVAAYLAQPHRIDFLIGRKTVQFFPDLRIVYRSGKVVIEKIRSDADVRLGRPDDPATDWARDVYSALGWELCVRDRAEIERGRALVNARIIEFDRFCVMTSIDVSRAFDAIDRSGGEATYGQLIEALGGMPRGQAVLHALIVRGEMAVDLDAILDADTPVWRRGAYPRDN
jgi:hypothetical protein